MMIRVLNIVLLCAGLSMVSMLSISMGVASAKEEIKPAMSGVCDKI